MADRRDTRFRLKQPGDGTVRMFADVMVQPNGKDEWIAIGREAAVTGETLVLDIVGADRQGDRFPVRVIDSRPVMVNGRVRHLILLHRSVRTPLLFEQQVTHG
jgi:hypothetical protein